ncbi:hypothetical protein ACFOVU_16700 [Nocardiopsis sediminis]|uniref:DUF885 domain-containing protein n=1 Tax=Nocardiopsis sediminis TaxID=1778267 RepID=A0ABV8FSF4_9ACTN
MTATAPGREQEWVRDYALLALRIDRRLTRSTGGTVLIYRGPGAWRRRVDEEEPPPAGRLADDADRLLDRLPFGPPRAAYLAAQVRALRAVARRLDGHDTPLPEYARQCLGIDTGWLPESVFEEAHDRLAAALPATAGPLARRLHAWQAHHTLPPGRTDRLPGLVERAAAETRARTDAAIVPLPAGEQVGCELVADAHYLAAGHHHGGLRSTIFINAGLPFNLADLLNVVAHEGHPGHIAESLLKERHLVEGQGRTDQQVRFMLAPSFVLSEGLGLHAQDIVFPGDQAQEWLADNVFAEYGIEPDGSDLAEIHRARNALWGAWANAALLAAEGRPDAEVSAYLSRWALLGEDETAPALAGVAAPGMSLYIFGYFHGWRILRSWLQAPDRHRRVRRLLTEQLLPADLEAETAAAAR